MEARGARVDVIVNHDHFRIRIRPELMDDDTAMVQGLIDRFCARGPRAAIRRQRFSPGAAGARVYYENQSLSAFTKLVSRLRPGTIAESLNR